MPSLKDLKIRINSVTSTRKITSAMKMVAASKLARAQERSAAAKPYAKKLQGILSSLASAPGLGGTGTSLLTGSGKEETVLLLVLTSDSGMCGGFNSNVVRETRLQIKKLEAAGKKVLLFTIGRKARDLLRRDHASKIIGSINAAEKKQASFTAIEDVATEIRGRFERGEFDVLRVVYNRFVSVISQVTTNEQLIPLAIDEESKNQTSAQGDVIFEPNEESLLGQLLPRNLAVQIYARVLESAAGEFGARMTAMDNATRNAGDMIRKLTLKYNMSRQAHITTELIEIISGAEAI